MTNKIAKIDVRKNQKAKETITVNKEEYDTLKKKMIFNDMLFGGQNHILGIAINFKAILELGKVKSDLFDISLKNNGDLLASKIDDVNRGFGYITSFNSLDKNEGFEIFNTNKFGYMSKEDKIRVSKTSKENEISIIATGNYEISDKYKEDVIEERKFYQTLNKKVDISKLSYIYILYPSNANLPIIIGSESNLNLDLLSDINNWNDFLFSNREDKFYYTRREIKVTDNMKLIRNDTEFSKVDKLLNSLFTKESVKISEDETELNYHSKSIEGYCSKKDMTYEYNLIGKDNKKYTFLKRAKNSFIYLSKVYEDMHDTTEDYYEEIDAVPVNINKSVLFNLDCKKYYRNKNDNTIYAVDAENPMSKEKERITFYGDDFISVETYCNSKEIVFSGVSIYKLNSGSPNLIITMNKNTNTGNSIYRISPNTIIQSRSNIINIETGLEYNETVSIIGYDGVAYKKRINTSSQDIYKQVLVNNSATNEIVVEEYNSILYSKDLHIVRYLGVPVFAELLYL